MSSALALMASSVSLATNMTLTASFKSNTAHPFPVKICQQNTQLRHRYPVDNSTLTDEEERPSDPRGDERHSRPGRECAIVDAYAYQGHYCTTRLVDCPYRRSTFRNINETRSNQDQSHPASFCLGIKGGPLSFASISFARHLPVSHVSLFKSRRVI